MRKLLVLLLILLTTPLLAEPAKEKISVQLKWFSSFQFAGYYMAKEKGFYDEVGLDVTIKERDPSKNNIEQVVNGESEYGVADSALLLYRARGKPVKILASIFQHSPLVFIAKKSSAIVSPYEMKGKIISYQKGLDDAPLLTMLKEAGINDTDYKYAPLDFTNEALIRGEVDVMSAYLSDQPFFMKERGVEISIINPLNYGVDFYGDNLFTTEKEIKDHPERVKAFKEASIKGWKYALAHKNETALLLRSKYNAKRTVTHLNDEARIIEKMMVPEIVDIGYTSIERFYRIAEMYHSIGKADKKAIQETLDGLIYDPSRKSEEISQYLYIAVGILLFLASAVIGLLIMSRHLKYVVRERTAELQKLFNEQEAMLEIKTAGFAHLKDRRFIWTNDTFELMLGYDKGELQGESTRIIHLNDEESNRYGQEVYQALAETGIYTGEGKYAKKDKTIVWLLVCMSALKNSPYEAIAVAIDITRQKQLEFGLQELVASETEKRLASERLLAQQSKLATMGEMMNNIAHQWRQPLNALGLMIQQVPIALEYDELDKEYAERFKDDSMKQIRYMSQTIDDFRNFFKPDKTKIAFCVKEDVKRACSLIKDGLYQANIALQMRVPEYKTTAFGYPNEFGQVVLNILSNAKDILEAKKGNRYIEITVSKENDTIKVTICDNAGGVPEDIIDKIFEPYFTTKHKAQGTGLGLYMSKMIIEQNMGGKLNVYNTADGACFEIELAEYNTPHIS